MHLIYNFYNTYIEIRNTPAKYIPTTKVEIKGGDWFGCKCRELTVGFRL